MRRQPRAAVHELHEAGADARQIAVSVALPVWRVEQLIDEHAALHAADADLFEILQDDLRAAARERLGALGLGDAAATTLAGAVARATIAARVADARRRFRALLGELGWRVHGAERVLNGTSVPNRALRERLVELRRRRLSAAHDPTMARHEILGELGSSALARRLGLFNDSHFERLIGLRRQGATRKRRPDGSQVTYPGAYTTCLPAQRALQIAEALGMSAAEIPGL